MRLILFSLFYFLTVKVQSCDIFNTVCNTVCIHDGSDRGVVINKKCYCADARNVDDVFAKLPISGKVVIDKEPVRSIWE